MPPSVKQAILRILNVIIIVVGVIASHVTIYAGLDAYMTR